MIVPQGGTLISDPEWDPGGAELAVRRIETQAVASSLMGFPRTSQQRGLVLYDPVCSTVANQGPSRLIGGVDRPIFELRSPLPAELLLERIGG